MRADRAGDRQGLRCPVSLRRSTSPGSQPGTDSICLYRILSLIHILPLISYNYASDNIKRMKHTLTFAAKISVTGLVLVSSAYSFFAGDLITMFMDNPEIVEMGSRLLRGLSLIHI